jgi:hypothetical protein
MMMTAEHWIDFSVQIVAVFLGAGLAFLFNWVQCKRQKQEENRATLDFLRASLGHIFNEALTLKEQRVQHRYKEAMDCETALKEEHPEHTFKIKHMGIYIYHAAFEWPMAQEKLEFLASPDPNVILLVGAAKTAISILNTIIHDINTDIDRYRKGEEQTDDNGIIMMIHKNKILFRQIDYVLYLTKKLSDVLIKFGHATYGKNLKKMEFELTDEKYKALSPKPIECWEVYEWFPPKKKRWGLKTEGTAT